MQEFSFGQWLKQLRLEKGLTRQKVADNSEGAISQQYVHAIEMDKSRNIGSEKLQALSKGLDVPLDCLQQALFYQQNPKLPILQQSQEQLPLSRGPGAAVDEAIDQEPRAEKEPLQYVNEQGYVRALRLKEDLLAPQIEPEDVVLYQQFDEIKDELLEEGRLYVFASPRRRYTVRYLKKDPRSKKWLITLYDSNKFEEKAFKASRWELIGKVIEVRKTKSLMR